MKTKPRLKVNVTASLSDFAQMALVAVHAGSRNTKCLFTKLHDQMDVVFHIFIRH